MEHEKIALAVFELVDTPVNRIEFAGRGYWIGK